MEIRWHDREDPKRPEYQKSEAILGNGWLNAEVYHTADKDEVEVPWNATISGTNRSQALIGYESMEEAKRAVEDMLPKIVQEIKRALD